MTDVIERHRVVTKCGDLLTEAVHFLLNALP